jgi:hypothetical protein
MVLKYLWKLGSCRKSLTPPLITVGPLLSLKFPRPKTVESRGQCLLQPLRGRSFQIGGLSVSSEILDLIFRWD